MEGCETGAHLESRVAAPVQQTRGKGHCIHRKGITCLKHSGSLGWNMSSGNLGMEHWDASLGLRETQHKYLLDQVSPDSSHPQEQS